MTIASQLVAGLENAAVSQNEDGEKRLSALYTFSKGFPAFQGHFPGQPVLPAIVQLTAVRLLCETLLHRSLRPVQCNRVKFRSMVVPGDQVKIHADTEEGNDERLQVRFSLTTQDDDLIASGEIVYDPER